MDFQSAICVLPMIILRTIHVHGYFTHRVTYSPFIWGKYLDQPLRVTCSDLKILFPPLFSIDKEQPERKEREIIYVSELQSLDRNFFFTPGLNYHIFITFLFHYFSVSPSQAEL